MAKKTETATAAETPDASASGAASKPPKEKKPDIFIRDSTYPDAEAAFRVRTGRVDAIKDACVFVLDTNTLLAPYGVGTKALGEIRRVFKLLAEQKRVCVPAQVARELADNRSLRLTEVYADVQRKRQRPTLPRSPLLESMSSYAAVVEAEKAVMWPGRPTAPRSTACSNRCKRGAGTTP